MRLPQEGSSLPTPHPAAGHGLGDIRFSIRSSVGGWRAGEHPSRRARGPAGLSSGGSERTKQGNDLAKVTWSWGRA